MVIETVVSRVGEMELSRHRDDYTISIDGIELMSSDNHQSEDELGLVAGELLRHLAAPRLPDRWPRPRLHRARRARRAPATAHVDIAEIVPEVVRWNRTILGPLANHPLADPRVTLIEDDVAQVIQQVTVHYDAIGRCRQWPRRHLREQRRPLPAAWPRHHPRGPVAARRARILVRVRLAPLHERAPARRLRRRGAELPVVARRRRDPHDLARASSPRGRVAAGACPRVDRRPVRAPPRGPRADGGRHRRACSVALCRELGAELCVTEFVNVEGLARAAPQRRAQDHARRRRSADRDPDLRRRPRAPRRGRARSPRPRAPAFIDINCGCWVPQDRRARRRRRLAARSRGDGRDGEAGRPRARRCRSRSRRASAGAPSRTCRSSISRAGSRTPASPALTIHCRTAQMGHNGAADWSWAARAREVVAIPVIVNGDVRTADDARARARRDRLRRRDDRPRRDRSPVDLPRGPRAARPAPAIAPPTLAERVALCREHLLANVEARGEHGVAVTRRHLKLLGPLVPVLKPQLYQQPASPAPSRSSRTPTRRDGKPRAALPQPELVAVLDVMIAHADDVRGPRERDRAGLLGVVPRRRVE